MDPQRYGDKAPGQLQQIETHGGWAFVPNRLPPDWEFPSHLWPTLSKVKQKLGELEGVGKSTSLQNPAILIKPLINQEALDSSTIEGTYTTAQELLLLQLREDQESALFTSALEVANYTRAIEAVIDETLPLNIATLCEMHRILLTGTRGKEKRPGKVRDEQVAIGNKARFVPPPPSALPQLLDDLNDDLNNSLSVDPLIDAFLIHYQFEAIHPFGDGNGRVGRALLALTIFRKCGFTKPWLYLSSYFEKHRRGYIDRLFRISTNEDWDSWIEFCLKATYSQAVATIEKCEQVIELQQDFEQRVTTISGSFRLQQILSELFERPFLEIASLKKVLDVTYPTAKSDVQKLVDLGILTLLKGVSPKTYYSPELYRVTYDPPD